MDLSTRRLLVFAAAVGIVHGAFSLYWALGGRWLLDTVGAWAVDWANRSPRSAGAVLLAVAAVKFGGAVFPLLNEAGRLPGSASGWRRLFLVGAVILVAYGAVNMVGAWIGVATGNGLPAATLGHAALWDPLFLIWGLLLGLGLRAGTRARHRA